MKLRTITPLIAIALVSCAAGLSNNLSANKEARDASIIISLKGDKRGDAAVKQQNQLCNQIASLVTDNFKVKDSYSLATNAILMDVPSAYVSDIRNLSFVSNVEYDTLRCTTAGLGENSIPLTTEGEVSYTDKDNASSDTMEKPEGTKDGEGVFIAILDTSFRLEHKTFTELDNDIEVKVTKESLSPIIRGSSFHGKPGSKSTQTTYWSNKVPFYYDYGGTATERTRWDVHDDLQVHGTHVASLAAGNDPDYKGIAPNAQLACMKVFTSASSAEEDVGAYDSSILAALEDCLALDVDIINMSLGNDLNDFEEDSAVRKVIKQLKEKDVSVCISAGNSGRGMYQQTAYKYSSTDLVEGGILSSYSNSSDAMIVASAQPDWQFYEKCLIVAGKNVSYEDEVTDYSSSEGEVVYKPERFLTDLTKEGQTRFDWVKVPGLGELKDYEDIDVEGKIAVVDRGEISFALKTQVAESKGAIAIFIINNDPTETDFTFRFDFGGYNPKIPVELVLYSDKTIFDTAGHGTLDILEKIYADNPSARQSSTYTSDGATFDLLLKPDISSPGNSISGAISFAAGDSSNTAYGALSGTSMASPNYAGALAVLISEGIAKKNLANITMSTAEPMKDDLGVHHRSPRIQGAGLINLDNALNSEIYLEGLDNDGSPLGSAKIQLQNNDDIKNGKVSLDFIAHSALSEAASLTATTYIYRPALKEYDAEQYPTLTGKFQGIEDDLIGTATQTITVNSGDTSISLNDYVISDTEKARIDENFEYGCSIEGFVFLTSKDFSIHVSIPFYGFYGDYSEAYPVEPFLWEREEGKTYQSDILNQFNIKALGLQSTDFRSDWVVGYYPNMDTLSIEDVLLNNSNLHKMKDYNQKPLRTICENESTGEYEDGTFYVGNNGATNTMIIQQFVTRSVTTNVITLKIKQLAIFF